MLKSKEAIRQIGLVSFINIMRIFKSVAGGNISYSDLNDNLSVELGLTVKVLQDLFNKAKNTGILKPNGQKAEGRNKRFCAVFEWDYDCIDLSVLEKFVPNDKTKGKKKEDEGKIIKTPFIVESVSEQAVRSIDFLNFLPFSDVSINFFWATSEQFPIFKKEIAGVVKELIGLGVVVGEEHKNRIRVDRRRLQFVANCLESK